MRILFKIIFFTLFCTNISLGQISVRLFNYRPTGDFGFVMKPQTSVEIGFLQAFEKRDRFRGGFSCTYIKLKPRMDVIPTSGVLYDGNGTTALPGKQSFQKYNLGLLFCDVDFACIKQKKINAFIGAGLMIGAAAVDYTSSLQSVIDESYQGGGILAGFRCRIGADFDINKHFGITASINRSYFLVWEPRALNSANDYGIGIRYTLNK